jgi:hypothetical protein
MIPEEDEDKNKTEYETAKKFFDPNKSKVHLSAKKEVEEESKKAENNNPITSNNISRLRNLNGFNREKSQDSISTFELTNEMDKSKVRNVVNNETNIKYAHDIFDFSKLNVIKETNSKDIFKETASFNTKLEPNLNNQNANIHFDRQSPKYHHKIESAFTFSNKKDEQPEVSKTQTAKRSQSNRMRKESFPQDNVKSTIKAQTPPDRKFGNRLPAINSQRRKVSSHDSNNTISETNSNLDIKSIFAVADGYKEDPIIKQKLDDIMQNIVDIRNVIDQKFKKRIKVASAPTNCEDAEFKALMTNRNDINSAESALNKIPIFDGKFKSNFVKLESANSKLKSSRKISGEISGFMGNISNITNKDNKMLKVKSKDVMPIKLMKK